MKKITSLFLSIALLIVFSVSVFANVTINSKEPSVVMAINEETIFVNGEKTLSSAPVLVLDKTYVDLYETASFLGLKVQWIEDYIGYFRIDTNGKSTDFTLIYQWEDLINQKHKFFVKDSKIYVSLRELSELTGCNITYNEGIITLGNQTDFNREIYGDVDTCDFNDYVYKTYPSGTKYVVYPYQAYSYETMMADAKKLEHMYPEIIKTSSIGKSVEGRDLLLIEFGKGENKIFVCGTHHAREYISTTYLMYTIDRYAYACRNGEMWGKYSPKDILDNVTFCVVPMVNPDGVNLIQNGIGATKNPEEVAAMGIYNNPKYGHRSWKANVRGVDLNWNYDKDWSIEKNKNPRGSEGFTGDRPHTEPETIAVSEYVDSFPFDAFISYHTQGEVFYWADNEEDPSYLNELIAKDTGFGAIKDEATGNGGSFFDYVYRKYRKPTITIELCPHIGSYPYPDERFDRIWKPAKNVMLIVANEIIYRNSR